MKNCLQSSPVENSPRSNSPPVNRRRSSVSIEARVETDDDAVSMSLSPRSEPSVPSSPLITIAEKCMITNQGDELIQEVHQRSIPSAEEVFGSSASTSDSFLSIPQSETPLTVSTTPVPVYPFNGDEPSVTLLSVAKMEKSDEDLEAIVFDEDEPTDVISPPDIGSIEPCDLIRNRGYAIVVPYN